MSHRKAIITVDGNDRQQERALHELKKFVSEANQEPELNATIQIEHVEQSNMELDASFVSAKND